MSHVGGFPGWRELNRRTVRAPVNPMDKATVVSIYPKEIKEVKHTLQPGTWIIPAGSMEKPATVVVGPSSWWREIDPEQPLLEIPVASILIADSIVRDWCNGLLGVTMGEVMPGLFYIPGEFTQAQVKKDYGNLLVIADMKQRKWYNELVKFADIAWATTNGNPLTINETMKMAARELGIDDRDWLKTYHAANMVRCFACGELKNPLFPICRYCRSVDPSHPKASEVRIAVQ